MRARGPLHPPRFTAQRFAASILLICGVWPNLAEAHSATGSVPATSRATTQAGTINWASLSTAQRAALAPLEKEWPKLDGNSQEKWLALANRFPSMSPADRERVQTRMTEWAHTPAAERGKARLRYQRAKDISPQERQAQWAAYQNLPEDQRHKLAEAAAKRQKNAGPATPASGGASATQLITSHQNPATKSNIVPARKTGEATLKSIAPTVVQAKPGATTNLVSTRPVPAPHLKPGLPKVAATPGLVDSATLLPRQGPQGIKAPEPASGASDIIPPAHPKKS